MLTVLEKPSIFNSSSRIKLSFQETGVAIVFEVAIQNRCKKLRCRQNNLFINSFTPGKWLSMYASSLQKNTSFTFKLFDKVLTRIK